MKICCIGWLLLCTGAACAQSTPNIQAEMKKAKKRIENDKSIDPEQKKMLLQMMNSRGMKNATQYVQQHPVEMARIKQAEEGKPVLPVRDAKRLASIPKTPINAVEAMEYTNGLAIKLAAVMDPGLRRHTDSLLKAADNRDNHLMATAMQEWLAGDLPGGAWLAAKAASVTPTTSCLNNVGAMLNMLGNEEKAVPALQYALKQAPKDAALLNNMGRAWLGLGETAKAKQLFLACVGVAPSHPEANNALGCIYEAGKDPGNAIICYQHSLEGAFNENAFDRLVKLQPEVDLPGLISHHVTPPRYFDEFNFQLPDECRDIMQTEQVRKVHEAFESALGDLMNQYGSEGKIEKDKAEKEMKEYQQRLLQALQSGVTIAPPIPPFGKLAIQMLVGLGNNYSKDKQLARKDYDSSYNQLIADFKQKAAGVQEKYQKLLGELKFEGEGGTNEEGKYERLVKEECAALLALSNEYQDHAATLHQTFAQRYRPILLNYFNARVYWQHFMSTSASFNNAAFYDCIGDFLRDMSSISESTPYLTLSYLCKHPNAAAPAGKPQYTADKKPGCPLNFKIGFVVGSMTISCTAFSISGGEGIKLGYKYNFANQQSTISVGAGLSAEIGIGVTAGASASESIYVTFDGNGHPSDVGFKFDAGAAAKIGAFTVDESAGYSIALNAGVNFSGLSGSRTWKVN